MSHKKYICTDAKISQKVSQNIIWVWLVHGLPNFILFLHFSKGWLLHPHWMQRNLPSQPLPYLRPCLELPLPQPPKKKSVEPSGDDWFVGLEIDKEDNPIL